MNLCSCWKEYTKYVIKENESYSTLIQICNGTKEREECSCNGDVTKCNFYPEKRKEKKIMNTAEIWTEKSNNEMTRAEAEAKFYIKIVD